MSDNNSQYPIPELKLLLIRQFLKTNAPDNGIAAVEQTIHKQLSKSKPLHEANQLAGRYYSTINDTIIEYALKNEFLPRDPDNLPFDAVAFFYDNVQARKAKWLTIPNNDQRLPEFLTTFLKKISSYGYEEEPNKTSFFLSSLLSKTLDVYGERSFYWACENGYVEIVKLLFELYSQENRLKMLKRCDYKTLDSKHAVEILLKRYDHRALRVASKNGHKEIVQLILTYHSPSELMSALILPANALIQACKYGHQEIVELLLEPLSEQNRKKTLKRYDHKALHGASKHGHKKIVQLILAYYSPSELMSVLMNSVYNPFIQACKYGHKEVAELLLEPFSEQDREKIVQIDNHSPLDNACSKGHLEMIKLLRENYSSTDWLNILKNKGILGDACAKGYVEMAELVLRTCFGADQIQPLKDNNHETLHLGCQNKHPGIIKLHLKLYFSDDFIQLATEFDCLFQCICEHHGPALKPVIKAIMDHMIHLDTIRFSLSVIHPHGEGARKRLILLLHNLYDALNNQDKKNILDDFVQNSKGNCYPHSAKQIVATAMEQVDFSMIACPGPVYLPKQKSTIESYQQPSSTP